jgi:hypothetical protein
LSEARHLLADGINPAAKKKAEREADGVESPMAAR